MQQMARFGIDVPPRADLSKAFDGYYRWRPSAESKAKKSAWARLYEFRTDNGRSFISGAFGWRGDTWQVEATPTAWTPAERAQWQEQRKAAARAEEAARAKDAETAAQKASKLWERARDEGANAYLDRKRVRAFGVRFLRDMLLVPLRDMAGELHGLQFISDEKKFGTGTQKEGHFHAIGDVKPDLPLCFVEGYATGATVHMATGWPVVVCFDAGNLEPVVARWRELYPDLQFVIGADDDRHVVQRLCDRLARVGISIAVEDFSKERGGFRPMEWDMPDGSVVTLQIGMRAGADGFARLEGSLKVGDQVQLLKLENAGRAKATACAKRHRALVLLPRFAERAAPFTDWNDLHVSEGLDRVIEQLLIGLATASEDAKVGKSRADAPAQRGDKGPRKADQPPTPPDGIGGFMERFTLIYGTVTVWDNRLREIIRLESLKVAHKRLTEYWLAHGGRQMVPQSNVVFDPTGKAQLPEYVNLFDRLPLDPRRGECDLIVEHLHQVCGGRDDLAHWLTCWLALPLQMPGTKMRTAVVLHGRTEGTGKSRLMDVMRMIYGRYSRSISQLQLQSEFTGWLSGMLFIVAEEVTNAADRKHHKGLLQGLVTGDVVQINEKNMPVRQERNHANMAFLSNEQTPMLLNQKDRRYCVIKVEREQPKSYFDALSAQIEQGGAEAFYDYLLNYDLQGFDAFTRPLNTRDRMHLITLSMSPDQRFFAFWRTGHAGVPFCSCTAGNLYKAFKAWCSINGERYVANSTQFGRTMSDELDRLKAPPKAQRRFKAWSDKQVEEGVFKEDEYTSLQAIVYFVPPRPPDDDPNGEAATPAVEEGAYQAPRLDEDVRAFQRELHELIRNARRGL
jgi:putative DNA primase/helicase